MLPDQPLPDAGPALALVQAAFARYVAPETAQIAWHALGVLAVVAAALVVYATLRARAGERVARSGAALTALNPGIIAAVLLSRPFIVIAAALALAAVCALWSGRTRLAWAALAGAIACASGPLVLLPLFIAAPFASAPERRARIVRECWQGALIALALLAPFAGRFSAYAGGVSSLAFNSAGAFNIYAIAGTPWHPEYLLAGVIPLAWWGFALLAGVLALIVRQFVAEGGDALPYAATLAALALFLLPTRVTPFHLSYALLLAPLLAPRGRAFTSGALLLGVAGAINVFSALNVHVLPDPPAVWALLIATLFFLGGYVYLGGNLDGPLLQRAQRWAARPRTVAAEALAGMTRLDYALVSGLLLAFAAIAYFNFWYPAYKVFDEVYYVRAGQEYLRHAEVFESTHPPLSKLIIALSIKLFGDTSFGWRCLNFAIGTAQIAVVYAFARRWLNSSAFATVAGALLVFDGFHFAQTRIATPEITVGFFTILTLYCFYRYWSAAAEVVPNALRYPAGVLRGCAIACALFAGLVIARMLPAPETATARLVAFVYVALATYSAVRIAAFDWARIGPPATPNRHAAWWFAATTLAMGALVASKWNGLFTLGAVLLIVAFTWARDRTRGFAIDLLVPALLAVTATIYGLAYLPYLSLGHSFSELVSSQGGMYHYHATLNWTHPYQSAWWMWPLLLRPIAYVIENTSHNNTLPCCIGVVLALPNPATWWLGLASVPFTALVAWLQRNKGATVIVTAYLCQWLPWARSPRASFEYHFYPNDALIALANALLLQRLWNLRVSAAPLRIVRGALVAYGALALFAFGYWYPIVSAHPLTLQGYQDRMWHWLMGNRWM